MQICGRFSSACMYSHLLIVCMSRLLCVRECVDRKRGLLSTIRTPHAPFKTMIICFVLLSVNYHYSFDSLSAAELVCEAKCFRAFCFQVVCVFVFACVWAQALYSLSCVYPQQYGLTTPDRTIDSTPWNKQIKIACGKQPRWDFTHWSSFLTDFLILLFPHWSQSAPDNNFTKVNGFQSLCIKMLNLIT